MPSAGCVPAAFPSALRCVACGLLAAASAAALAADPDPRAQAPSTPATARTQEIPRLTLDEVVGVVLAHNPGLRAERQAQVSARARVTSASALPNPRLEWSRGSNQARIPSVLGGRVQTWTVALPLENPWVRGARIDAAEAGERGSRQRLRAERNLLASEVRLLGYEIVLREAQAEAAQEAVHLLEQVRERVGVRVDSGEAARYEIIKSDAELVHARQQAQTARLRAERAQLALGRLAAGQLPRRLSLDVSLEDPLPMEQLQDIDPLAHPDLQRLQAEVQRARARLEAARARRWPGLELRYGQTREPEIRQQVLGISLELPLLDQQRGPIDEAASELERARLLLDGRRVELRQQTLAAWKALEMARVRTRALGEGSVREAEAALRVAQAAYRHGERGILDVLDAQRVLRSVRSDLLDARYQLQAARIRLEFLAGRYADLSAA